jgi:hypothetical protein
MAPGGSCGRHRPAIAAALVVSVALALALLTTPAQAQQQQAFLEAQLPLRPLSTTPSELLPLSPGASIPPVTLSGRQALTAVFSRPVIALGADFAPPAGGQQLPPEQTPFTTTCGVPGRMRWVTTSIARFDPSVEWPPDLRCAFRWNAALEAYDGAPLRLDAGGAGAPASSLPLEVPLRTAPLTMSLAGVTSTLADRATGGLWSAETGLPEQGDGLPEVPPGSNATLSFSYPVDLRLLSDALRLRPAASRLRGLLPPGARERGVAVLPCADGSGDGPWPLLAAGGEARGDSPSRRLVSTCAVVQIDPPLAPQEAADLVLPPGSRYAALAGPVGASAAADVDNDDANNTLELSVRLYGLRRFRLPLRRDFTNLTEADQREGLGYVGVGSRKLELWLPHGLADGTDASRSLAPLLSLCRLAPRPFSQPADVRGCDPSSPRLRLASLTRPSKGKIVATYPQLEPGNRYLLRVAASRAVRDAFGLPLEADATAFWTDPLGDGFQGPAGGGGGGGGDGSGVLIFEPGSRVAAGSNGSSSGGYAPLPWPLVSRGRAAAGGEEEEGGGGSDRGSPTVAARWAVPLSDSSSTASLLGRALQMVSFGQTQRAADAFSPAPPQEEARRPNEAAPSFAAKLSLPGSPGSAQLVSTCCRTVEWPTKREVDASAQLVLTTSLQAVAVVGSREVVVWVTRAVGGGAGGGGGGGEGDEGGAAAASLPSSPVAGARVSVWRAANPYGPGADPATASASAVAGMSCVTESDGACAVPAAALREGSGGGYGGDIFAVASVDGGEGDGEGEKDAIVVSRLPMPYTTPAPEYRGTLVLDRRLVRPGEQLKVAAFAARGADGALPLPGGGGGGGGGGASAAAAFALVSPNPSAARGDYSAPPLRVPVSFDPRLGTAHFEVPLPRNSTPGEYSLTVQAAAAGGGGAGGEGGGGGGGMSAKRVAGPVVGMMPVGPDGGASGPTIASTTFTVADPRPPTADLSLNAPTWTRPQDASVDVALQAVSYLGGAVAGAPVAVSWRVEGGGGGGIGGGVKDGRPVSLRPGASGSATAVTDAEGRARVRIDLVELREDKDEDARADGGADPPPQRLEVEATWVGPTRELIRRTAVVRLFAGPYRVLVERTLDTDVPGVAFGVAATALSNDFGGEEEEEGSGAGIGGGSSGGGSRQPSSWLTPAAAAAAGATVEIALVPANGTSSTRACTASQLSLLSQQRCSVASPSLARQCQLRLPCAGEFLLRACVVRAPPAAAASSRTSLLSEGDSSCSETRLGRNATEWRLSPWAQHPQLKLVPDRRAASSSSSSSLPLYREGDTATLAFQNPYWGPTSALVLWSPGGGGGAEGEEEEGGGDGASSSSAAAVVRRRLIASVPRGANAVRVPLTRESGCAPRGCRVAVVLSVGRPTADDGDNNNSADLPPVPASALFDPRAPHTESAAAWIAVGGSGADNGDGSAGGGPLSVELSVERPGGDGGDDSVSSSPFIAPLSNGTSIAVRVLYSSSSSPSSAAGTTTPRPPQATTPAPVAGAQVTVLAVDEAVLDLLPYPLQDVEGSMSATIAAGVQAYLEVKGVNDQRATREAVRLVFDALRRRLEQRDPWLPLETRVVPGGYYPPLPAVLRGGGSVGLPSPFYASYSAAPADVPDETYLAAFAAQATVFPPEARAMMMMGGGGYGVGAGAPVAMAAMASVGSAGPAPAPPPMAFAKLPAPESDAAAANGVGGPSSPSSSSSAAAAATALRLAEAFLATPLYSVVTTDADGYARVPFEAPANVGSFVVRAYAVAAAAAPAPSSSSAPTPLLPRYGSAETKLVVARPVSLVPSLPRLARVGDVFEAGVQVSIPADAAAGGAGEEDEERTVVVTAVVVGVGGGVEGGGGGGEGGGGEGEGNNNATAAAAAFPTPLELLTAPGAAVATTKLGGPGGKTQEEVRFRFRALSVGNGSVLFTARLAPAASGPAAVAAAGKEEDGLLLGPIADQAQLTVPVEARQGAVVIATSFAVRPGAANASSSSSAAAAARAEGLALPKAEPGSPSTVELTAGVGMLPAVQAAYTTVLQQRVQEEEQQRAATAPTAVSAAALPSMLSLYGAAAAASPPASAAGNAAASRRAAQVAAGELTDPRFGLMYVSLAGGGRGASAPPQPPTRADVPLNAWGSFVVARAAAAAAGGGAGGGGGGGAAVDPLLPKAAETWRDALARQLVADAQQARMGAAAQGMSGGPYGDLEALSWARLALGAPWRPPPNGTSGGADVLSEDLSMRRLTAAALAGNLTVGASARTGLALVGVDGSGGSGGGSEEDKEAARAIARRFAGQTRTAGRTAYVAASSSARSAAPLADQALALRLLVALDQTDPAEWPLSQKLAAFVAQGPAASPLAPLSVPLGGWDAALQAEALSTYDAASGSASGDLTLTATAFGDGGGGEEGDEEELVLLRKTFSSSPASSAASSAASTSSSSSSSSSSSTTPWSDLPTNASRLRFEAEGRGEASVAAILRFTPAEMLPFASYRGLWVQRAVVLGGGGGGAINDNDNGTPAAAAGPGAALRAASLGDVVTLVVQVTTPDDLPNVVVEAWMPAGLEPLDENLPAAGGAGGGRAACSFGEDEGDEGDGGAAVAFSDDAGLRLRAPGSQLFAGLARAWRDRSAASAPAPAPFAGRRGGGIGGGGGPWWWLPPVCPAQETTPSIVRFYYPFMRAGTHTLRFRAVAATPGRFSLPPTKAFAARQPEVMGLSGAGQFVVCDESGGAAVGGGGGGGASALPECSGGAGAQLAPPEKPAKACPGTGSGGCSGAGVCNLSTGTCVCDAGWQGEDCSSVSRPAAEEEAGGA